jgi:hypothetical protein
MAAENTVQSNGQPAPSRRKTARNAAVTALAAIVALAMWAPLSAEVTDAVVSELDGQAQEAARVAADYGDWLRAAHGRAGANALEQPLPAQF